MKLYSKLARPIGILALGLVLVGGSFALAPRAYAVEDARPFPCTIEVTSTGKIYQGTWVNGVCQPNQPIPQSGSSSVVIDPVGFFDRIKLWFTFVPEKKADLLQNFSNRNFELAKQKLESGNAEEADKLFMQADIDIQKASKSISKIWDEDMKDKALSSISVTKSNRVQVLTAVQAKIENPVAKEAIQNAILRVNGDVKVDTDLSAQAGAKASVSGNVSANLGTVVSSGTVAKCLPTSTPSVTVISPNGGETYTAGQQITVKWKTCNLLSTDQVAIGLLRQGANGFSFVNNGDGRVYGLQNDGVEIFTLPSNEGAGLVYKIDVDVTRTGAQWDREDTSDNLITIN